MANPPPARNLKDLPRKLGLWDATNIVIGIMVGSAIFLVPNTVAQNLPSAGMILAVWTAAGVLSFFGALAYAELGAMMPDTGGQYVYLSKAWGPLWGFLCGWTFILAARSAGIATVAAGAAGLTGESGGSTGTGADKGKGEAAKQDDANKKKLEIEQQQLKNEKNC